MVNEIILLATGPSVRNFDLNRLRLPLFGVNYACRIHNNFKHYLFLYNLPDEIINLKTDLYTSLKNKQGTRLGGVREKRFSLNVFETGLSGWSTITLQALELIYSLGYRRAHVLGFDAGHLGGLRHAYLNETGDRIDEHENAEFQKSIKDSELFRQLMPVDYDVVNYSVNSNIKAFRLGNPSHLYAKS